jgi:hypothetical protein
MGCQGVRRTRKVGSAQQTSICRLRTPAFQSREVGWSCEGRLGGARQLGHGPAGVSPSLRCVACRTPHRKWLHCGALLWSGAIYVTCDIMGYSQKIA